MNRFVVIAAACSALCAIRTPAAAQHEHHRVTALDSLTVRAKRDAVQLRSGATVVDTRASAAAAGSIADLLRTVPGVELDADGRISMRGSTSVLVLMNGRRILSECHAARRWRRRSPCWAGGSPPG
jgi:outer membrane receptor for ferrienterochelin and colicin